MQLQLSVACIYGRGVSRLKKLANCRMRGKVFVTWRSGGGTFIGGACLTVECDLN